MKKDATRGMFFVIIGFAAAILAVVLKINMQTSDRYSRLDAERDFAVIHQQLVAIKANQETLKKRQLIAMKALKIDLIEPTTRP